MLVPASTPELVASVVNCTGIRFGGVVLEEGTGLDPRDTVGNGSAGGRLTGVPLGSLGPKGRTPEEFGWAPKMVLRACFNSQSC